MFWDKKAETLSRKNLNALQLKKLKQTLSRANKSPFYKKIFKSCGAVPGAFEDLSSLKKIPFTTKEDLRNTYPYGTLCVSKERVIRLHASSGTTGTSTVVFHTSKDIFNWTELLARSITATG